jgi:hypothetical protein
MQFLPMLHTQPEINRARICIVVAALLWSVGGLFTRLPNYLGRVEPIALQFIN